MAYSRFPSGDDKLISRFERLRKSPKDGWPPWTDRPGFLRIVLNADGRVDAVRSWSASSSGFLQLRPDSFEASLTDAASGLYEFMR